jgi:hypothetical protein
LEKLGKPGKTARQSLCAKVFFLSKEIIRRYDKNFCKVIVKLCKITLQTGPQAGVRDAGISTAGMSAKRKQQGDRTRAPHGEQGAGRLQRLRGMNYSISTSGEA